MTGPSSPVPVVERPADEARWLRFAVDLAVQSVARGGGPFGAVVVHGGALAATGQNRVTRRLDPTAHAEVEAIRAAGAVLGDFRLTGCVLYSSCEPCPMCVCAALWARVARVVHAAGREDAASAGFDDAVLHGLVGEDPGRWPMRVERIGLDTAGAPFAAWSAREHRQAY